MKGQRHAILTIGEVYKNRGGGEYKCLDIFNNDSFRLINIKSHWKFIAHTITMYKDGSIEWDYSIGGYFDA